MRALIFDGESVRLDRTHVLPKLEADEVVVALSKALISPIDLARGQGLFHAPGVLGQQFVGIVQAASGAAEKLLGKRVVGNPIKSCGRCDMCLTGLSPHCRHRVIYGMTGSRGCLADRFVWCAKNLIPAPESLSDEEAVFAWEVASAMQAASQVTITGKPFITVIGDSAGGLLTAQIMSKLNASVRWMGWQPEYAAVCEKWGLKHRMAEDAGRRADQDIVVICSDVWATFDLAMSLVRPRGKVLLKSVGAVEAGPTSIGNGLISLVMNEVELIGSFGGSVSEALRHMALRQVDLTGLATKRMSLNCGEDIVKTANQAGMIGLLVEP